MLISRRRALSDDERTIWSHAMRDVVPLRGGEAPPPPQPSPTRGEGVDAAQSIDPQPTNPPPPSRGRVGAGGAPGSSSIDKSTLTKIKRGDMPIDGRLDLHGLTQARAHAALDRFADQAVARGARTLLVITGKGVGGDGVLRQMMPRWLVAGPHATRVLRVEPAHAKHGGSGAWYVYLRRRRDS